MDPEQTNTLSNPAKGIRQSLQSIFVKIENSLDEYNTFKEMNSISDLKEVNNDLKFVLEIIINEESASFEPEYISQIINIESRLNSFINDTYQGNEVDNNNYEELFSLLVNCTLKTNNDLLNKREFQKIDYFKFEEERLNTISYIIDNNLSRELILILKKLDTTLEDFFGYPENTILGSIEGAEDLVGGDKKASLFERSIDFMLCKLESLENKHGIELDYREAQVLGNILAEAINYDIISLKEFSKLVAKIGSNELLALRP